MANKDPKTRAAPLTDAEAAGIAEVPAAEAAMKPAAESDKLKALFERLQVTKVVVVDDAIDRELDAALVDRVLGDAPEAAEDMAAYFPDVDLSSANEHRFTQIESLWSGLDAAQLNELRAALAPHAKEVADLVIAEMIKALAPKDITTEFLTPKHWAARRAELIGAATDVARTLFLFDQELNSGDEHDFSKGSEIISQLSKEAPAGFGTRWFCGILSHTLDKGAEIQTWKQMEKSEELELRFFMPISKQNLYDADAFYGAVYRTVITSYTEQMKSVSKTAFTAALSEALARFSDLDPIDFEHVIVTSSEKEGVSELETLIRLYSIVQKDNVKAKVLDEPAKGEFLSAARSVKNLIDLERALPEESQKRLASLRHEELYEAGDFINRFRDPLRNGDLFEAGKDGATTMYVLIAQPCDLMVRKSGKRGLDDYFKVAVLAKIYREKLGKKPDRKGASFMLERLDHGGLQGGLVVFPEATPVDLRVLDLSVINDDGQCQIDVQSDLDAELSLSSHAWTSRLEHLRAYFRERVEKIEDARKKFGDEAAELFSSTVVPSLASERSFPSYGSYNKGKFSYCVRRCGRVREPVATSLLAAFSQFLARDAFEHDFAS